MDQDGQRRLPPDPAVGPPPDPAAGPPPPPFLRRRRRRRNAAIGAALAVIVGVPLVLGVISNANGGQDERAADNGDDPSADGDDPSVDGDGTPDTDTDAQQADPENGGVRDDAPEGSLDRPDAAAFDGIDAVYAELLGDIDTSELSMIGFQDALSSAFGRAGGDGDRLSRDIVDAASSAQRQLLDVRARLVAELDDDGADSVRESYVAHLDSWARYMGAVESDPTILGSEERTRVYILAINVTAEEFARTLEEALSPDLAAEVRRFADDILDRGFRGISESNV